MSEPRGATAPGWASRCWFCSEANARPAPSSSWSSGSPPGRRRVASRPPGKGLMPIASLRTTRCSAVISCFRRPWNHRASDAKALLGAEHGARPSGREYQGRIFMPALTSANLAKSAAGPADGRPSSLPDAVLAPRSESGARRARRLDLTDRPWARAALATW